MLHGTGIFAYMFHKFELNVSKYSSPMEHLDTIPPKFNIAPEKLPSQRESSLPTIIFRGYVKLREGIPILSKGHVARF